MAAKRDHCDVLVAGSGVAGLAVALALRSMLGGRLRVTLCDKALAQAAREDHRAFAIAPGPRRMLEALGAWESVAPAAQPIHDMVITDSDIADPIRPALLSFGQAGRDGEPLAHMVEQRALRDALTARARQAGVRLLAEAVQEVRPMPEAAMARLADGTGVSAALVVACDGAASPLREAAGIDTVRWSYPQSGIVGTIGHARDHEGRAEQHFLPSGPFAILPLAGRRSSIVWTERAQNVPALLGLDDADLLGEIERRFGLQLGRLTLLDRPTAFSLSFAMARRFVAPRLALVGDAAHVIHPLAGQGLNLGLRDAQALVDAVAEAASLGLDPGAGPVLERYERARRFDTLAMGAMTDGLNRLFSHDSQALRVARGIGLRIVDGLPGLKAMLIRQAASDRERPARRLRGALRSRPLF